MTARVLDFPTEGPQPLANMEAEQQLLGCLLTNNDLYEKVSEIVGAEDFSDAQHQEIYRLIEATIAKGEQANAVRLRHLVKPEAALYLVKLVGSVVVAVNAVDYALTVRDLSMRRRLFTTGLMIQEAARTTDLDIDPFLLVDKSQQLVSEIGAGGIKTDGPRSAEEVMVSAMRQIEAAHKGAPPGLRTGLKDLDSLIGGLEPGTLTILAARPGMGKSALAVFIANLIRQPTAFFSLEMSAEQLGQRAIAAGADLPLHSVRTGRLSVTQLIDAAKVSRDLHTSPVYICDTPARTVTQMLTRARQIKARYGLALVIIDHLQLIQPSYSKGNRTEIVTEISGALKAMAKTLDVPLIVLSQLSRAVEGRDDKRPMLADLRESGSIEQDADLVIFLYRESYYQERQKPKQRQGETADHLESRVNDWREDVQRTQGLAELIVEKQRQGPTGTVTVHYNPVTGRFGDLYANDRGAL